jgi:hypothetical protein
MIYDVTNPNARLFTNLKKEMLRRFTFIPASKSDERSLVIVSSEG